MTLSKIVRSALVAGTGAALVLATGVGASAQNVRAADVTTATAVTAAPSEPFDDLLALLAQLPEFQGKTLAQIQAEIAAAIQAQIQADAAADAAAQAADAQADAAAAPTTTAETETETETETDTDKAETDANQADVENQSEAPKVQTVSTVKTITPPREESRESAIAKAHEQGGNHGGHDR